MDEHQRRILKQHVETDQLLGVDAVPVGDPANAPALPQSTDVEESAPVKFAAKSKDPQESSARPGKPLFAGAAKTPAKPATSSASKPETQAGTPSTEMPAAPAYRPIAASEKAGLLDELNRSEVMDCRKCVLCEGRTQTVFGEGDPNANLMFVGEGPGQNEDETGRPFIGRAGNKLSEMITAMGLSREQVFIANVVKCRPPNNRAPTPVEAEACWPYLLQQIATIQPMVIVTLGGPAAKRLVNPQHGITRVRGLWHHFAGLQPDGPTVPVLPTFHPSYLLRVYTPENRKKVWSDLQTVITYLKANGGM